MQKANVKPEYVKVRCKFAKHSVELSMGKGGACNKRPGPNM